MPILGQARRRLRRLLRGRRDLAAARSLYEKAWEAISRKEDEAKLAVSGFTDEGEFRRAAEATLATLERTVGIRPDDAALEIGCGVGRVGAALAPRIRHWTGGDVAETMLAHTRRRLAGLPNVRTVKLSGYDLAPIAPDSLDLVYSTVVFMHLEEWDRFAYIREAMRVLRPGGRLYVDNVDLTSHEGWAFFGTLAAIPPGQRPPYISKTSTPQELTTYLDRAGFADVRHESGGLWVMAWGRKPGG